MASKGKKVKVAFDGKTLLFLVTDFSSLESKVKDRWKLERNSTVTFFTKDGEELGDIDLLEENDEISAVVQKTPPKGTMNEEKAPSNTAEKFSNKIDQSISAVQEKLKQIHEPKELKKEKKIEVEEGKQERILKDESGAQGKVEEKTTQSVASSQEIVDAYSALLLTGNKTMPTCNHTLQGFQITGSRASVRYSISHAAADVRILAFVGPVKLVEVANKPLQTDSRQIHTLEQMANIAFNSWAIRLMKLCEKREVSKVIITGFGAGGAIATILAIKLLMLEHALAQHVVCITFGGFCVTPRVLVQGNKAQPEFLNSRILHLIHKDDVLPGAFFVSESIRLYAINNVQRNELGKFDKIFSDSYLQSTRRGIKPKDINARRVADFLNDHRKHNFFAIVGRYCKIEHHQIVSNFTSKCEDFASAVPWDKNIKKKDLNLLVRNFEKNFQHWYGPYVEKVNNPKLQTRPCEKMPSYSLEISSVEVSVFPEDSILEVKGGNLEFLESVQISQICSQTLQTSYPSFSRIRFPSSWLKVSEQQLNSNKTTPVNLFSHFTTLNLEIPLSTFRVVKESIEQRRRKVAAKLGAIELMRKALVLAFVYQSLGFAQHATVIYTLFEKYQLYIEPRDYIQAIVNPGSKKMINDIFQDEFKFDQVVDRFMKGVDKPKETTDITSLKQKYPHLAPYTEFLKFLAETKVKVSKTEEKDGTTKFKVKKKQDLKFKHKIDFGASGLQAASQVNQYALFLAAISASLSRTKVLTHTRDGMSNANLALSIPLHLLVLPLTILTSAVGLIVGGVGAIVAAAMREGETSLALVGGGIGAGLAWHVLVYLAMNGSDTVLSTYEEKVSFVNAFFEPLSAAAKNNISPMELFFLEEKRIADAGSENIWEVASKSETLFGNNKKAFNQIFEQVEFVHSFRRLMVEARGIAVMGTSKTGKSTFLNQVWGCPTDPRANKATETMTAYRFDTVDDDLKQLFLLDLPGSDEINPLFRNCFKDCEEILSLVVIIVDAQKVNLSQRDLIKEIYQLGVPFILCLNAADRIFGDLVDKKPDITIEEIRASLTIHLNSKIELVDCKGLTLQNTFLTCFDNQFIKNLPPEKKKLFIESDIFTIHPIEIEVKTKGFSSAPNGGIASVNETRTIKSQSFKAQLEKFLCNELGLAPNLVKKILSSQATSKPTQEFHRPTEIEPVNQQKKDFRELLVNLLKQIYLNVDAQVEVTQQFQDRFGSLTELKKGGQAATFTATDSKQGKRVVLKRYHCRNTSDKQEIEQEFKKIVGLSHPNIIVYKELINASPVNSFPCAYYLLLPYYQDGDLAARIANRRTKNDQFSEKEILAFIKQIGGALKYLHGLKAPVIHRDIKPANILLDGSSKFVLTDFGISTVQESQDDMVTQSARSTPMYAAPELGVGQYYSPKVDVWGLGCVVYEMATLRTPKETYQKSVQAKQLSLALKEPIRTMVVQMLAVDPEIRISAESLVSSLK